MELYRIHQIERAHPFEGLNKALETLKRKGVKMYCVTNKPNHLAHTILNLHFGEGFFEDIIGADERFKVKPDPESTLYCMKAHNADPSKTLYVGDSHVDIATGHNAGLPVALCLWGYEVDYEPIKGDADILLSDPRDLLNL